MSDLVCYCFGYSQEDIIKDMDEHQGESTILAGIIRKKQQGACNCSENHPEHR